MGNPAGPQPLLAIQTPPKRRSRLLGAWLPLVAALGLSAPLSLGLAAQGAQEAQAQANPREARKAYQDAKKAYQNNEFDKAAELFKEAYDYDPKPELLFNIGQALKEAGQLAEAESYYKRYLDELPQAPNREDVLETLFELQQLVAAQMAVIAVEANREGLNVFVDNEEEPRCQTPCIVNVNPGPHTIAVEGPNILRTVEAIEPAIQQEIKLRFEPQAAPDSPGTLRVSTDVTGAQLLVDGKPAGALPTLRPLELAPGAYPLAVSVKGVVQWSGSVQIEPGELSEVAVPLKAKLAAEQSESSGGDLMGMAAFSLWGVGAGSLVAGAFFGLSAGEIEGDLDAQLTRGEVPNEALIAQGESQALFANLFFGVGVAAIGAGVVLLLLDEGGGQEAQDEGAAAGVLLLEGGALLRIQSPF